MGAHVHEAALPKGKFYTVITNVAVVSDFEVGKEEMRALSAYCIASGSARAPCVAAFARAMGEGGVRSGANSSLALFRP